MAEMNTNNYLLEVKKYFYVAKTQILSVPFLYICLSSLALTYIYSAILGILLVLCYFLGAYISHIIIPLVPDLIRQPDLYKRPPINGCTVCGGNSCERQKNNGEHHPWIGLDIPRDIDQALQDLFNKVLNEFIGSWYGKFTKDESFLWEIRERLRFACSILLRKILKTDVGEVISERLVPLLLRHVDDYACASDGCKSDVDKLATVVAHLGDRVHPAARSRNDELEYLKAVSQTLADIGLYPQERNCRAVSILLVELLAGWLLLTLSDTLCSPYVINTLLWLAISPDKLQPVTFSPQKVQFLKAFVARPILTNSSPLRSSLSIILNQPKLLYAFMQYLKRAGVVHLLEFCLNVESFNRRLIVPDVSPSTAAQLYVEAWNMYHLYLKPESSSSIQFSPGLVEQFHNVLSRGNSDISRLQTSTPLFQAYEEAFCLLEQTYLPGFHQSELYFEQMCMRRDPVSYAKVQPKKGHEPLVSKLSQKLQKLVSNQTVYNSPLPVETAFDATDLDCSDEIDLSGEFEFRDMSDWKVNIIQAQNEQDANSRPYPVFYIKVVADIEEETWEVKRKLNDFYTLQKKLLEFHQKLTESLPPNKGLFSPRGEQYLESRRQRLEHYLQRLVKQPELRCSDLLHCFLRSPAEFQIALHNPLSIYGLLRKSVDPIKLRKERGRHLDTFFNSLMSSVDTTSSRYELLFDMVPPVYPRRDISKTMFEDNLFSVLKTVASWPPASPKPILRLSSSWDCFLYAAWRLFKCPNWIRKLLFIVKSSLGDCSNSVVFGFINSKLQNLLLPRLPYLLRLLQNAILSPSKTHTLEDTVYLKNQVLKTLTNSSRSLTFLFLRYLAPNWQDGVFTVIETLQHPTLNKHLFYCLLDEVLRSLFTEFSVTISNKT